MRAVLCFSGKLIIGFRPAGVIYIVVAQSGIAIQLRACGQSSNVSPCLFTYYLDEFYELGNAIIDI